MVPEIWTCADLQNGPQKKQVAFSVLPIRPATPPPNPSQATSADEPSAFDVVPGEASDHMAFLSEPWAIELSRGYHFKLMFGSTYYVASMVNRTALTLIPTSDNNNDGIHLVFSNNTGKRKHETVRSCYLAPAPLRRVTKELEAVILQGEKKGQIFQVLSVNKKKEICKLQAVDQHRFEEQLGNICIVVRHQQTGCECAL